MGFHANLPAQTARKVDGQLKADVARLKHQARQSAFPPGAGFLFI
ncbi:hypothetical protein [Eikenella corrodens]|nr:hypothetical protein [Eikenella corrodens]